MGKYLKRNSCRVLLAAVVLLLMAAVPAMAFSVSDWANGWSAWGEYGAVLMIWERPSSSEASRVMGFEIWRNFELRDIVLREDDSYVMGYCLDTAEPAGIAVVDLEIDLVTGSHGYTRDFIYWEPDEEGNPTWQEFLGDNQDVLGVELTNTSVHYGWVPTGPNIGQLQFYRIKPIIIEQDQFGQWHLVLGESSSPSENQVIPVGAPFLDTTEITGNQAKFQFETSLGTDEAILQVARPPGIDENLASPFVAERTLSLIFSPVNPYDWSNLVEVVVNLADIPGTGNIFWWRAGSRNSGSTTFPRPWPATAGYILGSTEDPNYGWVWSDSGWLSVTVTFADIWPGFWAFGEIENLAEAGIVQGFPDGTYQPTLPVTRDAMAVYVARAMDLSDKRYRGEFSDIPEGFWAESAIEALVEADIVTGFQAADGSLVYQPDQTVDRATMTVFLARAQGWVGIDDEMTTAPTVFPDVPVGFWAGTAIKACREHEVVQGYPDGLFYPNEPVIRDQMAVFVERTFLE